VLLEERGDDRERFALRVIDDGPGIPEEMLQRVVERSFRTDEARSRVPDGLGLGLSIAKDVAELHGLSLAMRRSAPGGLEVEFDGPRLSTETPNALGPGDPDAAPRAS
jgi:signal transduction histidine kinase